MLAVSVRLDIYDHNRKEQKNRVGVLLVASTTGVEGRVQGYLATSGPCVFCLFAGGSLGARRPLWSRSQIGDASRFSMQLRTW